MTKQDQIDISNLRFYAAMAREFRWQTDIIDWRVVEQTLNKVAERIQQNYLDAEQRIERLISMNPTERSVAMKEELKRYSESSSEG